MRPPHSALYLLQRTTTKALLHHRRRARLLKIATERGFASVLVALQDHFLALAHPYGAEDFAVIASALEHPVEYFRKRERVQRLKAAEWETYRESLSAFGVMPILYVLADYLWDERFNRPRDIALAIEIAIEELEVLDY